VDEEIISASPASGRCKSDVDASGIFDLAPARGGRESGVSTRGTPDSRG